MKFQEPTIRIQKGDILTSKKGFLQQNPISNKYYMFHKQKYLGNGCWEIIGIKQEIRIVKTGGK